MHVRPDFQDTSFGNTHPPSPLFALWVIGFLPCFNNETNQEHLDRALAPFFEKGNTLESQRVMIVDPCGYFVLSHRYSPVATFINNLIHFQVTGLPDCSMIWENIDFVFKTEEKLLLENRNFDRKIGVIVEGENDPGTLQFHEFV